MPKSKPDKVIVHRIELQEKERELIEPFVKAKEIEQYGKTASTVVTAGALGVAVYVGWWTTDALFGWMSKAKDKAEEIKARFDEIEEQTGTDYGEKMKSSSPAARIFLSIIGV